MANQDYLPTQFFLKPGYAMANQEASVIRAVLGNCVAVTFFDREADGAMGAPANRR